MVGGDKRAEKVFSDDFEQTYRHLMERAKVTQEEMMAEGGTLTFLFLLFVTPLFFPAILSIRDSCNLLSLFFFFFSCSSSSSTPLDTGVGSDGSWATGWYPSPDLPSLNFNFCRVVFLPFPSLPWKKENKTKTNNSKSGSLGFSLILPVLLPPLLSGFLFVGFLVFCNIPGSSMREAKREPERQVVVSAIIGFRVFVFGILAGIVASIIDISLFFLLFVFPSPNSAFSCLTNFFLCLTGREQIQLVPSGEGTTISFNVPEGPPPEHLVLEGPGTEDMDIGEVRKALQMRWDVFCGFPEVSPPVSALLVPSPCLHPPSPRISCLNPYSYLLNIVLTALLSSFPGLPKSPPIQLPRRGQ
jgi:hypothetical protein